MMEDINLFIVFLMGKLEINMIILHIKVNIVAPGIVETDMGRRLVKATRMVEDIREIDATSPFGHVCQPEDVANVVRYLVSTSNSYITGEKIYVDGLAGAIR